MAETIAMALSAEAVRWLADGSAAACREAEEKILGGEFVLTPAEAAEREANEESWRRQAEEEERASKEDEEGQFWAAEAQAQEMEIAKRQADEAAERKWRADEERSPWEVGMAEWEERKRAAARKRESAEELAEGQIEDKPYGRPPGSEGPTRRELETARYRWAQLEHAARSALGEDVGLPLDETYAPGTRHEMVFGEFTVVSFDRETADVVLKSDELGGEMTLNAVSEMLNAAEGGS